MTMKISSGKWQKFSKIKFFSNLWQKILVTFPRIQDLSILNGFFTNFEMFPAGTEPTIGF